MKTMLQSFIGNALFYSYINSTNIYRALLNNVGVGATTSHAVKNLQLLESALHILGFPTTELTLERYVGLNSRGSIELLSIGQQYK